MKKRKQNAYLPFILLAAVIVVTVISLVIAEQVRQAKIDNPGEIASQDDVPRLTATEAYEAQQSGQAVIVDTRSAIQYDAGHIAGSISLPLDQLEIRMGELDPETWYITYCT